MDCRGPVLGCDLLSDVNYFRSDQSACCTLMRSLVLADGLQGADLPPGLLVHWASLLVGEITQVT
jgi:hypothetical protein